MLRPYLLRLFSGCALVAQSASAAPGITAAPVTMHCGPSVHRGVVLHIPGGAPIEVFECASWCRVGFAGTYGFIPARLVVGGYTEPAPRDYYAAAGYPWSPEQPPPQVLSPALFPTRPVGVLPPAVFSYRAHYRRGDGAYFEFEE
jgi:hypothetical protein